MVEQNKLGQQKIDIMHKLNMLKKQKEKLEELKNVYENDLKIYYKIKEEILKKKNYTISELFIEKYKVFNHLEINSTISFENFNLLYRPETLSTSYDDLFISNDYENKFINNRNYHYDDDGNSVDTCTEDDIYYDSDGNTHYSNFEDENNYFESLPDDIIKKSL